MSAAAPKANKKTVYVDADEEITSVIDKVQSASDSIVALVLPKRAAVFQSIVNMKLLKRAADQNRKKVVLITSESTVLPLAGTVGLHVAANLNSKPYVPSATELPVFDNSSSNEEPEDPEIDPATPIGLAAGLPSKKVEPEAIEIDNRPKAAAVAPAAAVAASKKAKKGSKLKVPNFQKFRVLLFAGGALLILLIFGLYWAFKIAPSATVTIQGETSDAQVNFAFTAATDTQEVDEDKMIAPAILKELKKTDSEKVPATGQKDKGNKASGTMSLKNCSQSIEVINIPAGTGVSSGDFTFITQQAVVLPATSKNGLNQCTTPNMDVPVIAQSSGDKYNISARSYNVTGYSGVIANGSAMTGGTSQVVKVVSQSDIDAAKSKITDKQAAITDELKDTLKREGYIGVGETFASKTAAFNPSPAVDSEANEVTVSSDTTYTMLAIKEDDLEKLVKKEASHDDKIKNQNILTYGLKDASFQVGTKKANRTSLTIQTKVVAGPDVDEDQIKTEVMGKKRGEAEQTLKSRPGVKEVRIDTKPFWNYSIPKKSSKIKVVIEGSNGAQITD